MRLLLITTLFIVIQCDLLAQSPYRVFALDCNLNSETERQTASLVTKAFLLNHLEFIKDSKRIKPYAPLDWAEFQRVIDSLQAKIPINSEYSWEEDYGLKTPPAPKHERWKEITFYESNFERNGDLKAIVRGKRKYILQIKVNLDANGQIESIQYIKGKDMKNREAFILHAYKILYKPVKKQ
jgi:hypothetical protein